MSGGGEIIYSWRMDRSAILARLKEHEAELRRRGVARVALFGSAARGEARPDSDIDLMVDVDPAECLLVPHIVMARAGGPSTSCLSPADLIRGSQASDGHDASPGWPGQARP